MKICKHNINGVGHCDLTEQYCSESPCPHEELVEYEPVKHGRWTKHSKIKGFVYCSACKDCYIDSEWLKDGKWQYCPTCGAKMDEEAPV